MHVQGLQRKAKKLNNELFDQNKISQEKIIIISNVLAKLAVPKCRPPTLNNITFAKLIRFISYQLSSASEAIDQAMLSMYTPHWLSRFLENNGRRSCTNHDKNCDAGRFTIAASLTEFAVQAKHKGDYGRFHLYFVAMRATKVKQR